MKPFKRQRPRDLNLEVAIANRKQKLKFYVFNEPAINTFSETLAMERAKVPQYRIVDTIELETSTLEEVLGKHLPENCKIDFLSIDVEGLDIEVLQSLDFTKHRPSVILIEMLRRAILDVQRQDIALLLARYEYTLFAKTVNTAFFVENGFLKNYGKPQ